MRRTAAALLVTLCLTPALRAQDVRGVVRDSASGDPVAGAVILVLDSAGRTAAQQLTSERGLYRVVRTPAARRLRVLRIGYRPREMALPAGPASLDIALVAIPVLLETVQVTGSVQCPRRDDSEAALALLGQARAGLLAVMVARRANPAALVRLGFERRMDGLSDRIVSQQVRIERESAAGISFDAVRTPAEFLRLGFVAEQWGQQRFLAPDADVLLDDTFANGYCFRVAERRRDRPDQVGLGFAAAGRLGGRVDIDGTLWIDTVARALVDIEFQYTGLPDSLQHYRPGGRIGFRTMPNGLVLVERWVLRLVGLDQTEEYSIDLMRSVRRHDYYYSETGGELARATWPDGTAWRAPLGAVRVRLRTPDGSPLPNAGIRLADTHYRGTGDSVGTVEIRDLVPGPYAVALADPRLAAIDLELPTDLRFVAVRDSTVSLTLRAQTAEAFTAERCRGGRRSAQAAGALVLGRVYTLDGRPRGSARVFAATLEGPTELGSYTTGSDGVFAFCVPASAVGQAVGFDVERTRVTATVVAPLTVVRLQQRP